GVTGLGVRRLRRQVAGHRDRAALHLQLAAGAKTERRGPARGRGVVGGGGETGTGPFRWGPPRGGARPKRRGTRARGRSPPRSPACARGSGPPPSRADGRPGRSRREAWSRRRSRRSSEPHGGRARSRGAARVWGGADWRAGRWRFSFVARSGGDGGGPGGWARPRDPRAPPAP